MSMIWLDRWPGRLRVLNLLLLLAAAVYFLLSPAILVTGYLLDPKLAAPGISRFASSLFASLTPRYEKWARDRVASGSAAELSTQNISGTEWPLFGSVFYLWAVQALQDEWEKDQTLFPQPPRMFAHGAVDAASTLVLDEHHAGWVRRHWGDAYLVRENVFYRALRIAALTARVRLLADAAAEVALRHETTTFLTELDRSPHGVLDDYPGECYPADVLMALYAVQQAGCTLGEDYGLFLSRARRGFQGALLDREGMIPYSADAREGRAADLARGCGNSYVSLCAPELWPQEAKHWYDRYVKHFWQDRAGIAGFREFYAGLPGAEWYLDVDSGPVVGGFGVAASAFGAGAARANGRFDQAQPLTGEMLVTSWPLPDRTLLLPRVLSDGVDAPYLGEAAILYVLTRQPVSGTEVVGGGTFPAYVSLFCAAYWLAGGLVVVLAGWQLWQRLRGRVRETYCRPRVQCALWLLLLIFAVVAGCAGNFILASLSLLFLSFIPRSSQKATIASCGS